MDEVLLKAIDLSIVATNNLAKEYLRRARKYELEGDEELRSYWFCMYQCLKNDIVTLNKNREQLLREES